MSSTAGVLRKAGLPVGAREDEGSIRRWGLLAGIGILVIAALSVFANFVILENLVTPGDASKTATDILASKGLFQLGIAGWILIVAADAVVAWALFRVFRPTGQRVAMIAAWARLLYAGVLGVAVSQLVQALGLLGDQGSTSASNTVVQAEALQKVEAFTTVWDAGLVLFGIHLLLIGYLAYRSGYVSKVIGALVAIAGFGYLFDSVGAALAEDLSFRLSVITGLGEFALGLWLVVRGRRISLPESKHGPGD